MVVCPIQIVLEPERTNRSGVRHTDEAAIDVVITSDSIVPLCFDASNGCFLGHIAQKVGNRARSVKHEMPYPRMNMPPSIVKPFQVFNDRLFVPTETSACSGWDTTMQRLRYGSKI